MITFSGTVGALFNALGLCGALIKTTQTYQASQLLNFNTSPTSLTVQLASEADIQSIIGSSFLGALAGPENSCQLGQQAALAYLDRKVYRDTPQPGQTLTSPTYLLSIVEVIIQMKAANQSVQSVTVTATPQVATNPGPVFTGIGTGCVVASTVRPFDGLTLANAFSENVSVICSNDSYTGGATAGNEGFLLNGQGNQPDLFAFNWPGGSGAAGVACNAIDGDASNTSGNLLTNSGFASWAVGLPSNFTSAVGSGLFSQNTGVVYSVGSSLQITGDGATNASIQQVMNNSVGTTATLSPQTEYAWNGYLRRDGTAPAAGVLSIDLIDGNSNIINDAAGTPNTFTIPLTALTTTFTNYGGVFRTPTILPSAYSIRYRLSTPLTNGRSVYVDKTALGGMTQLITNCPFFAVFAGSVPFVQGDIANVTVVNGRGAGGTLSTWQTALGQLLDPYVLPNEIIFPYSNTPTISDSLL